MRRELTPELKKDYLDNFGTRCPYCDSEDIGAGSWDFGTGEFWQEVKCHTCKEWWTDVYTLTGIEENNDEPSD